MDVNFLATSKKVVKWWWFVWKALWKKDEKSGSVEVCDAPGDE
ncbi:hypothetical protein LX64_00677 [Chitinophaga skermanii]|uniref:Uncharacterized protein n=1 Tax=Chitinophaga skermanii TaxID=331697 RepID=A0A327R2Y8_9BACT|nr:hypothetical protein [Chitinophaga skermanii]RAJ11070.1 hypothetical protein LX64_00677 [Chitinophaga skermanii]